MGTCVRVCAEGACCTIVPQQLAKLHYFSRTRQFYKEKSTFFFFVFRFLYLRSVKCKSHMSRIRFRPVCYSMLRAGRSGLDKGVGVRVCVCLNSTSSRTCKCIKCRFEPLGGRWYFGSLENMVYSLWEVILNDVRTIAVMVSDNCRKHFWQLSCMFRTIVRTSANWISFRKKPGFSQRMRQSLGLSSPGALSVRQLREIHQNVQWFCGVFAVWKDAVKHTKAYLKNKNYHLRENSRRSRFVN